MEKTLEQLHQEYEETQTRLEQAQHKLSRLQNRIQYYSKGERQKRAHRLITRGAAIESILPQVKAMAEQPFYALMEQALLLPEVRAMVDTATSGEDE